MEIHPDAGGGGREEEQGWQAASKLGLSDTSDSISLAEAGDAFSSLYITILPNPFQKLGLWWSFFLQDFYHMFISLCMRKSLSQMTLSPFA